MPLPSTDRPAIEFTVPFLPPKECSPNARVHWRQRNKASRYYKEAVYYSAINTLAIPPAPFQQAELTVTCIVGQLRARDEDNWKARFKPGQDALITAGIIARDDVGHLKVNPMTFIVDKIRAPATLIRVVKVTP